MVRYHQNPPERGPSSRARGVLSRPPRSQRSWLMGAMHDAWTTRRGRFPNYTDMKRLLLRAWIAHLNGPGGSRRASAEAMKVFYETWKKLSRLNFGLFSSGMALA